MGQVTDQVEVNAQNSAPGEEIKTTTTNTQVEGDDEAALLERLARREERRQKRLQEALERQKEFEPTITDASLSLSSRRMQNNTRDNETAEKEGKSESRQELEETEIVTKSHQKNDWMEAEEKKKEEKEKEEEEEEKPKPGSTEENQLKDEKTKKDKESQDVKSFLDAKKGFTGVKSQNGEFMTHKLKHTENTFSRAGGRVSEAKEAEGASQAEASGWRSCAAAAGGRRARSSGSSSRGSRRRPWSWRS